MDIFHSGHSSCFDCCVDISPFSDLRKLHSHIYVLTYEHLQGHDNALEVHMEKTKSMLTIELRNIIIDMINRSI